MNAPRRPEAVTEPAGAAMETWAEKADEVGARTLRTAWRVGPYTTGCVVLIVVAALLVYYVPPIRSALSDGPVSPAVTREEFDALRRTVDSTALDVREIRQVLLKR